MWGKMVKPKGTRIVNDCDKLWTATLKELNLVFFFVHLKRLAKNFQICEWSAVPWLNRIFLTLQPTFLSSTREERVKTHYQFLYLQFTRLGNSHATTHLTFCTQQIPEKSSRRLERLCNDAECCQVRYQCLPCVRLMWRLAAVVTGHAACPGKNSTWTSLGLPLAAEELHLKGRNWYILHTWWLHISCNFSIENLELHHCRRTFHNQSL